MALLGLAFLFMLASCSNNDDKSYPSNLEGIWIYADTGTTETGALVIENISGGQYSYFAFANVSQSLAWEAEGSFIYNSETGSGYINTQVVGGTTVSVQAFTDSKNLKVLLTAVVSGESEVYEYVFRSVSEENVEPFHTGTWNGSSTTGGITTEETLEITTLDETSTSFGTFSVSATGTPTKVYDITGLSPFIKINTKDAIGIMEITYQGQIQNAILMFDKSNSDLTVYFDKKAIKLTYII